MVIPLLLFSAGTIRKLYLGWSKPVTWISALPAQGWVAVVGKVKGDQIKNWSGDSECVFWHLQVKEYRRSGEGGGYWKTIYRESSGEFELDDMTGRVKVQTKSCDFVLSKETVIKKIDDTIRAKIENLGIKTKGFLGIDKRFRLHLRTLVLGEEILVLGKFQKDPQVLTLSGGVITPLVISNLGKAKLLKTYILRLVLTLILPLLIVLGLVVFYLALQAR
jgi:hypothetical protein